MQDQSTQDYIQERVLPVAIDVEVAERAIIDYASTLSSKNSLLWTNGFISYMRAQKNLFHASYPVLPVDSILEEQICLERAELATREAIISLQAKGIFIPYGGIILPSTDRMEKQYIEMPRMNQSPICFEVEVPSLFPAYRIAAKYREDKRYQLASDAIYISYLDKGNLPSRAKRCLRECVNAYQASLYLSATMTVGAASESLWMNLGRAVCVKISASTRVQQELNRRTPSINNIIEETWVVLKSQCDKVLQNIFNGNGKQLFKDHADRLCYRRNYAMHYEDADEDEPMFTYSVVGMLLLESLPYFNQLVKLIEAINSL